MKDRITEESIKSLQQEGLRFSVDTLAERLKISKKTVYKYFPTKEALANAIYEKYYADLHGALQELIRRNAPAEDFLRLYFDSAKMSRKEIFNKYALNRAIGDTAAEHHLSLWNAIASHLCPGRSEPELEILKVITDGAFANAVAKDAEPDAVITVIRRLFA